MTRFQLSRRDYGLVARVALLCACLILPSLLVGAGGSVASGLSGSTPSAESLQTSPAAAIDGLAITNHARHRLLPAGLKVGTSALAAILLGGTGRHLGVLARRFRRAHLVLDDVGDRWRALLIGAPPALFSI